MFGIDAIVVKIAFQSEEEFGGYQTVAAGLMLCPYSFDLWGRVRQTKGTPKLEATLLRLPEVVFESFNRHLTS